VWLLLLLLSQVWDLRNRKLLRSVPLLDGTSITFNSSGPIRQHQRADSDEQRTAAKGNCNAQELSQGIVHDNSCCRAGQAVQHTILT
jgi:hypothetical protein